MLKKSSLKNSLYCLKNFAYTYLGPCLLFRVLGMNPRHSSYSKFLLAVLVTSFFVVLVFSLYLSSVLVAPEGGISVEFSSAVVRGVAVNCSIIYD